MKINVKKLNLWWFISFSGGLNLFTFDLSGLPYPWEEQQHLFLYRVKNNPPPVNLDSFLSPLWFNVSVFGVGAWRGGVTWPAGANKEVTVHGTHDRTCWPLFMGFLLTVTSHCSQSCPPSRRPIAARHLTAHSSSPPPRRHGNA